MSCIPKLLEKKKENPYLSPNIYLEGGGNYKGYNYCITLNSLGTRCGYVAISKEHPDYDNEEKLTDLKVHGGVTFLDNPSRITKETGKCNDKWVGFDAGHTAKLHDKLDSQCAKKYFSHSSIPEYERQKTVELCHLIESITMMFDDEEEMLNEGIRDFPYMENECKGLIDQLCVAA